LTLEGKIIIYRRLVVWPAAMFLTVGMLDIQDPHGGIEYEQQTHLSTGPENQADLPGRERVTPRI
jgi:hypothetical protein